MLFCQNFKLLKNAIAEAKLRTSMARIKSWENWVDRPISAAIFTLIVIVLLIHVWSLMRDYKRKRASPTTGA